MHIRTTEILRPILDGSYREFLRAKHKGLRQRIVIDFSSPNIAKPFHFGHFKSTILGNFLANINEFVGNEVIRLNYVGDWGTQYGLLSLGLETFEHDLNGATSPNQKLRQLLDIYVKANELGKSDSKFYDAARHRFKELCENTDTEIHKKWLEIRNLSLEELKHSYQLLGITFDQFEFESDHTKNLDSLIKQLEVSQFTRRSTDGMLSATIQRKDKAFEIPILKADGTSLYITRDVAAAIKRKEKYNFDKMFYVVGLDQEKHFHCLIEIIKKLGYDWYDQLVHVKVGKVLGMSSRKGTSILLTDIIEEATKRYIETTKEIPTSKVDDQRDLEDVGRNLALSALFVYDMRMKRTKNYAFDWHHAMIPSDTSGVQLQTTFARLCSLLRKNQQLNVESQRGIDHQLNPEALDCIEASNLLDCLDNFAIAIDTSVDSMNSAQLLDHTFGLCRAINRARRSRYLRVMGEDNEDYAKSRLILFKAAHIQLELILRLLGLKPLTRV